MVIQSAAASTPQTSNLRQASAGSQVGALVAPQSTPQQGGEAAGGSMSISMSMTSTSISSSVETMLGEMDPQLGSDEMLQMAITMLILEALLGQDTQGMAQGAMLMSLLGSQGSSSPSDMSASVSSQSLSIEVGYSAQSASAASGADNGSGN